MESLSLTEKCPVVCLNSQFFYDLGQQVSDSAEIEIRIPEKKSRVEIFSDDDFWQIIGLFDWSKEESDEIMAPAIKKLADMPVVNIRVVLK